MSSSSAISVTEYVGAGGDASLKLQGAEWELNVLVTRDELALLSNLRAADWSSRRSLRAGRAAGAAVFWAYEDEHVSLLVGQDDEAWDLAVRVPAAPLENALARAFAALSGDR